MKQAKITCSLLYLFTLLFLALVLIKYFKYKKTNGEEKTEIMIIDKKYKARIINTVLDFNKLTYDKILLESFKGIITIADEKECPVLRYEGVDEVIYYVISDGFIYLYSVGKMTGEESEVQRALIEEV